MDGVTERVNAVSSQCMKKFEGMDKRDWADYLASTQFSYNAAMHSAIKHLTFKVAYGVDVLQPIDLTLEGVHLKLEFNQDGEDMDKKCEKNMEKIKLLLEKIQNRERREVKYEVRQEVLLNVKIFTMFESLTLQFMSKFIGLFPFVTSNNFTPLQT